MDPVILDIKHADGAPLARVKMRSNQILRIIYTTLAERQQIHPDMMLLQHSSGYIIDPDRTPNDYQWESTTKLIML